MGIVNSILSQVRSMRLLLLIMKIVYRQTPNLTVNNTKDELRKEIADILKSEDLKSIIATQVSREVEEKLDCILLDRKEAIIQIVDTVLTNKRKAPKKDKNGSGDENDEESDEEEKTSAKHASTSEQPPAKKAKKGSDESVSSGLPDDTESEQEYAPHRKYYHYKSKMHKLSPELAALVGHKSMTHKLVYRKVLSIIKKRNLYDPEHGNYTICDDALFKVMGVKRFRTVSMRPYLNKHILS